MASYNKNPAALNEPDGIVAVWNLHMLERPEFVFHSQVRGCRHSEGSPMAHHHIHPVRCSVRNIFALPLEPCIRWYLLWPNPLVGYPLETFTRSEDATECSWAYTPRIRYANGRDTERAQLDH